MTRDLHARIDHLVVAASTLKEGIAWCETTLGLTPGPGGSHALFGTHNRLLRLASKAHVQAYLEIIAIDPQATPLRAAPLCRWFDLDDPAVRKQLAQEGPQLVHWVASVSDIDAACAAWRRLGIERGPVIEASRPTPEGLLRWRIAVRDGGQRLLHGTLPTLIQWGQVHPADHMPEPELEFLSLQLQHPQAAMLRTALDAIGLAGVTVEEGLPALRAQLAPTLGAPMTLSHQEPA